MSDSGDILHFKVHADSRGKLVALQEGNGIPFLPARIFYIYDVQGTRECHAHYNLQQLFVALSGACTVGVDDGDNQQEHRLTSPDVGLYVKKINWIEIRDFSPDCRVMVLASAAHCEKNYIRDYDEFLQATKTAR